MKGNKMKVKMSRSQLWDLLSGYSTNEVIDFFTDYGLEFEELDPPARGVYRREEGLDLVYHDGQGVWTRVDWSGYNETHIVWACMDYDADGDWWVQVLDKDLKPISYGDRVLFDSEGKRLA